jgi:predicted DNA binding protein
VHTVLCESPALDREYTLWGQVTDGVETVLGYVEGDRAAYEDRVGALPSVRELDTTADGDGFFVYLRAELRAADRRLGAALSGETVVWVPPVVSDGDGTVELTLVGHPDDLGAVTDDLPAGVDVADLRVSDHAVRAGGGLTDRQRRALSVAWEAGYYEQPREADLAAVADRLGVALGTASELLRRAERELVRAAVGSSGPGWRHGVG